MSTQPTRRAVRAGQPEPELSKLKTLWATLSEDARAFWRERLFSGGEGNTQPEIRRDLLSKLKVNLQHNSQLTEFKRFVKDQDKRDEQAARMVENERRIKAEHPEWTLDQVREEVLRQTYFETLATGDFKLGLAARKSDLAERSARFKGELETEKLKLAREAEARAREEFALAREKFELEAAAKLLDKALRAKADEINNSNLTNADKIAAMRKAAFKSVDELEASGRVKIPKS